MKYTKATNYALHTMLIMAKNADERISVQHLAEKQDLSPTYLSKILTKLVKGGFISSFSGAHGGYALPQNWENISFLDIIHCMEGKSSLFECCLNEEEECSIKKVMLLAEEKMEADLKGTRISDLIR
jgi:Rrf2 family protein